MKLAVRRQYFRMARRALAEGKLAWLVKSGVHAMMVPLAHQLGKPIGGPVMANLVPTYRCNNACFMCDLPKPWLYEARGNREFTTGELTAVIDDLAALGTVGLSLAGGEPTIRPDCFELLAHGVKAGLFVHLNTNGYNLHQEARVEALVDTGIESMNFSLDGATAETHNRLRNAAHGFERIARATALVRQMRHGGRPAVTYTFVVGPDNYTEVPAFVELARRAGVESVSFNPLTACYVDAAPHADERLKGMDAAVAWLREEKARSAGDFIDNSDDFLSLFPRAFRAEPSPLKCYVGYHNVVIDCYGNIYSCTMMYQNGKPSGNLTKTPLREFWESRAYQQRREELTACKACFWNCHTELNLLYQRASGVA